jgi:hypothetical protein
VLISTQSSGKFSTGTGRISIIDYKGARILSQAKDRSKRVKLLASLLAITGTIIFSTTINASATDIDAEQILKTCLAAQPQAATTNTKSKKGPLKLVFKGLGSEAKANSTDMAKDLMFVFSAQDVDPYKKSAPTDKPYTLFTCHLVDGTLCKVIKYPDNSDKVVGGFADGTIVAPLDQNTFVVGYPNGARGKLEKLPDGGFKIYRPDKSITTMTRSASGRYSIRNNVIGYMGDAFSDRSGMQFEFKNDSLF